MLPTLCAVAAGQAAVPLDLLHFEPRLRPFGSHVLAANAEGAQLEKHCVQPGSWFCCSHMNWLLRRCCSPSFTCPLSLPCSGGAADHPLGVPSVTPDGQVTSHGTLQVCA